MDQFINILIAVGIIVAVALFSGILLALSEHYLVIDNNSEEDVDKIEFYLPSYNCGACGHVNCRQVARGIVDGKIKEVSICKVISQDNAKLIREYCKEKNIEIK